MVWHAFALDIKKLEEQIVYPVNQKRKGDFLLFIQFHYRYTKFFFKNFPDIFSF